MRKLLYFTMLCLSLSTITAQQSSEKDHGVLLKTAWLEKWNNSKNYLLEIAQAMPESHYSFKPTTRQMSFQQQLEHIQQNMLWLGSTYFSEEPLTEDRLENISKDQVIDALEQSFDKVAGVVENTPLNSLSQQVDFFAGPKNKFQILQLLQDHVTHHRGQLIVYLNMNNIPPPRYVGW